MHSITYVMTICIVWKYSQLTLTTQLTLTIQLKLGNPANADNPADAGNQLTLTMLYLWSSGHKLWLVLSKVFLLEEVYLLIALRVP